MEAYLEDLKSQFEDQQEEDVNTLIDGFENHESNDVNTYFKLPIVYNKHVETLKGDVIDDLELKDKEDVTSLYKKLLKPNHDEKQYQRFENQLLKQWSQNYTTDKNFLLDTQSLIQKIDSSQSIERNETNDGNTEKMYQTWLNFKNLKYFNDKYQYFSWNMLEPLNRSSFMLMFLCFYNMSSPIISLVFPILMMLLPFLILRMRGIDVSFSAYWEILKVTLRENSVMKLITQFDTSTVQEKAYSFISMFIYLIQIYQNIQSCIMFYQNLNGIMDNYDLLRKYIKETQNKMKFIASLDIPSYSRFHQNMNEKMMVLQSMDKKIGKIIKPKSFFFRINQIGYIMKTYHELHYETKYHDAIMYSFGFNTYFSHMQHIKSNIDNGNMNFCTFSKGKKNTSMKNSYYIALIGKNPVKNSISMKKNIMITGPNASGKTTILKGFLINHILSQQIGCGCYDSCTVKCSHKIYSYLNIPDTSGRDSLFQAEARRCKTILDEIKKYPHQNHLCIFDELFSGTNPSDAVDTASGFISYMCKQKSSIRFLITTHYFDLCKIVNPKFVSQKSMVTSKENGCIQYLYKIQNGTNETKAGKDILKQMHYPTEILK